jgi:hypothetical protein
VDDFFLGVIAVAVLLMAISQVGALIYAARLARRVDRLTLQIEQDIRPLFADLRAISTDAARAMSLAAAQVERAERLLSDISGRVEQTFTLLQTKILAPVREGAAILAGVRAALAVFRDLGDARSRPSPAVDEEDALFIG